MAKEKSSKEASKAKEAILNKLDALKKLQGELNKEYGQGSVFIGSDGGDLNVKSISTGSLQLDDVIGIGGVPRGRIIEIYGPESSGKTTLALSIIAQAQKNGGVVAFVDAEHALDRSYAADGISWRRNDQSQGESSDQSEERSSRPKAQVAAPTQAESVRESLFPADEVVAHDPSEGAESDDDIDKLKADIFGPSTKK